MNKQRITITLDGDVHEYVKDQGKVHRMSVSGVVNWMLAREAGLIQDMQRRADTEADNAD